MIDVMGRLRAGPQLSLPENDLGSGGIKHEKSKETINRTERTEPIPVIQRVPHGRGLRKTILFVVFPWVMQTENACQFGVW
jgi:heptaprenylglyceryl phosphate synthase